MAGGVGMAGCGARPLPPADRDALRAGLRRLLTEVMDGELHALDNLDDLFARTAAALVALLDEHPPDSEVVQTVHQFLNQPLNLLWWHLHRWAGNAVHIDDVAIWTTQSPYLDRREFFRRPWSRLLNGESYK
jgi:hypothetical protein